MAKEIFRGFDLFMQLFQFSFKDFQVFVSALFFLYMADFLVHLFKDFMQFSKEWLYRCGKDALFIIGFFNGGKGNAFSDTRQRL